MWNEDETFRNIHDILLNYFNKRNTIKEIWSTAGILENFIYELVEQKGPTEPSLPSEE